MGEKSSVGVSVGIILYFYGSSGSGVVSAGLDVVAVEILITSIMRMVAVKVVLAEAGVALTGAMALDGGQGVGWRCACCFIGPKHTSE